MLICNSPNCGAELGSEGSEFLVTSCGHAFCSSCAGTICNSARNRNGTKRSAPQVSLNLLLCRCGHCDAVMTDDDVHICSPLSRQDSQAYLMRLRNLKYFEKLNYLNLFSAEMSGITRRLRLLYADTTHRKLWYNQNCLNQICSQIHS